MISLDSLELVLSGSSTITSCEPVQLESFDIVVSEYCPSRSVSSPSDSSENPLLSPELSGMQDFFGFAGLVRPGLSDMPPSDIPLLRLASLDRDLSWKSLNVTGKASSLGLWEALSL